MGSHLVNGSTLVVDDGNGTETDITIGEVISASGLGGGESEVIDVTNWASTEKEYRIGLADYGTPSLTVLFDPDDSGQDELEVIRKAQESREFTITLPDTATDRTGTFTAFVTSVSLDANLGDVWRATVNFRVTQDLEWA
jgi:hypothetical protein